MSFFNRLFGKKEQKLTNSTADYRPKELSDFITLSNTLSEALSKDAFLSHKTYASIIESGKPLYDLFSSLEKDKRLPSFLKGNAQDVFRVQSFLQDYGELFCSSTPLPNLIRRHNEDFISRHLRTDKEYLDSILSKSDPGILLDEEQRRVILSDEDYTLVVAGAGAGKTTTIAAKVRYLVEKQGINPNNILIVSFTNKAVDELRARIKNLGIDCPISTFHSAGYAILRKKEDEKLTIVDSGFLYNSVENYLKSTVLTQPDLVRKIVLFFGSYFDAPFEDGQDMEQYFQKLLHLDTSTLKGNMPSYESFTYDRKTGRKMTLNSELVRSLEEVRIANFLFLNQIDYIYEDPYKYHILRAHKPYTPDFHIMQDGKDAYIEHFGITENGTNDRYSKEELWRYKKSIADKIKLHRQHKTNLITSYSQYNDGRDLLFHLKEKLIANGFELSPTPYDRIYKQIASNDESKYIAKLVRLIVTFMVNFKTNGFEDSQFDKWRNDNPNVRIRLFLDIAEQCYLDYQRKLKEKNAVDFEDMINRSARMIREYEELKGKIDFKYIIVDEYQDISRQRFNLTKELSKMCDAKIMAVGDDWQSIYAYAGSDISLFTKFSESMGYADELKITRTYRNSQEVINIAGNFIQKNKSQIQKQLVSSKSITEPVIIETYSERTDPKETKGKGGKYYGIGKAVENIIGRILDDNPTESDTMKILLIGRYGFDARNLCFSEDFWYDQDQGIVHSKKYRNAKLFFLTAHRSKGLGFDNVIILNARDDIYGFPAKIDNDPVLKVKGLIHDDRSIEYAEERRLFYVAMTRTKNRVYIVTPKEHPSEFVRELIKEYGSVVLHGELDDESETNQGLMKRCPVCGYPLQLRQNKNIGLRLWMCTNETEMCDFITNELNGGELQIQKCDECRDGYLIVKKGANYFLGCTNYKKDGSGCGRVMGLEEFRAHKAYDDEVNEFSDDFSTEKPSFLIRETDSDYENRIAKEAEKKQDTIRKTSDVHKVHKEERFIEKEGFEVIADEDGELLTDWNLLLKLKECRDLIAFRDGVPRYIVAKNKWLVLLATYKPKDENDCSQIREIPSGFYSKYGKELIQMYIEQH